MTKPYKCRVEYLESTGTQYIDTGFVPTSDNFQFEIKMLSQNTSAYLGYRSVNSGTATGDMRWFFNYSDGRVAIRYGNTTENSTLSFDTQTTHRFYFNGSSLYVDDVNYLTTTKKYTTPVYKSFYLFSVNVSGYYSADIASFVGRIYYAKIWDKGVLARDFIPVLDNSGRPAMYDQVSGQLFYNQGSGDDFSYGRQIIPVEYLESTGTQYIDTGLKGKNGYDFDYKFNSTRIDGTAYGIGGEWENGKSCYLGLIRDTNYFGYHYQNTNSAIQVQLLTANTDYRVQAHLYSGEQYYILNGTKSAVGTITGTFTSTSNMRLFSIYSSTPLYSYVKMYYCKIWDNGVLVRDFIPCIDENLVPFMFDKVNNTVYLNAGTGQFKVGPKVEKFWGGKKLRRKLALALANLKKKRKYYCEVEYLEGTGTQYIDTGLDYFADFEISIQLRTSVANKALGNGAFYCMQRHNAANPYWDFTNGSASSYYTSSIPITEHHVMKWKENKVYADGVLLTEFTKDLNTPNRMYLYSADGTNKYPNMIYFCKLWNPDNGELVRDFIPVLDWNMTPCMYDKVTEQLFYNQATSGNDFSYGREIHYVDYLESTGTQYINTGLLSTASSTVDTLFSFTSMESGAANNVGVFGGRNATTTNTFTFFKIASAKPQYFRFDYNGQPQVATESDMTWNTTSKYRFQYNGTNCITTNTTTGESVVTPRSPASTFTQYPIHLFAVNTAGAVGLYLSGRIYYYKYSDGTKSVDMVPAIDENGVGYMLDRVSHTIYDNAGTGAFGYSGREVEYLQSDGARAIVAGVTVDDTCGYDVKWMALNANDTIIMGTKGAGDTRWVLSGSNNPNVNLSWNKSYGSAGLGLNKIQTAQMNYMNDRKRILNDIPLVDITETLSSAASTYNVGIFGGYWGATTISLYSTCRIYYAKISKGTGLIRDFVPMVKDGSPCLFDKIGGLYYFGTGAGTFTRGKIVEPKYE